MKRFTPDPERENEVLWGDKRGFFEVMKDKLKSMEFMHGNGSK